MTKCNFCKIIEKYLPYEPQRNAFDARDETVNIHDVFLPGKILGNGRFSSVRQGLDRVEGSSYAIKKIRKSKLTKQEHTLLNKEIKIQSSLSHPNIIKLYASITDNDYYYIFTEMAHGGEFLDEFSNTSYTPNESKHIMKSLLGAIKYCHDHKITHRDIKPANIFLANDFNLNVKIGDWGFATYAPNDYYLRTQCGTPAFIAPEILLGRRYGTKVDLWSLGVVFYQLMFGYHPFYHSDHSIMFFNITHGIYPQTSEFVSKLLNIYPKQRYTAKQALLHSFLQNEQLNGDMLTNAIQKLKASVLAIIFANKMSGTIPQKTFDAKKTFKATVKLISASRYLSTHLDE